MKVRSLAPHTFTTMAESHDRHPFWLHRFNAAERHTLIQEDVQARTTTALILAGAFAWGILSAIIVLAFVA